MIYKKPVTELLKDFINLWCKNNEYFEKKDAINWFKANYPLIKKGTLSCHLILFSTNAESRVNYTRHKHSESNVLFKEGNKYRRYDELNDPPPIYGEKHKSKKKNNVNKTNAPLIKKQQNESPYEIAQKIKKIILKINEICKINNKRQIFDQAALFELWSYIEDITKTKNDFKNFSENLYKLLREKTRYDNPNKKNKDDPKYFFLLPIYFIKIDPLTSHFWNIVNTLRHYYVHDEIGKNC